MKLEICIDSYKSFLNAKKARADRVEICSSLQEDGLSPSPGLVSLLEDEDIEKFVMIRPRAGNFTYSKEEFLQMKEEIKIFKSYKIDGFVFGILDKKDRLDLEKMKELINLASPFPCVLHRACDYAIDFYEKMDELIALGFIRILTSGKKDKAIEGLDLISKLEKNYGKKIEIMAGSGLNYKNIEEIYKKTGIKNFHMSARINKNLDKRFDDFYIADFSLIKKAKTIIDNL